MNKRTACEEVNAIGIEGLRQLARSIGILRWTEPPEVGFWEQVLNATPKRSHMGCLPLAYRQVDGADSVIVEWELLAARAHPNVLSRVADQLLTSLRINRVLIHERVDRSNRVIQILTNDPIVEYPSEESVTSPIPGTVIELRSHRASRPATPVPTTGAIGIWRSTGSRSLTVVSGDDFLSELRARKARRQKLEPPSLAVQTAPRRVAELGSLDVLFPRQCAPWSHPPGCR